MPRRPSRKSRKRSRKPHKSRKSRKKSRKRSRKPRKSRKSRKSRRAAVLQAHTANSRTWLGGVMINGKFIKTTSQKVKKAMKRLMQPFANKVRVEVKKHKRTKFFAIYLQWNEQLNKKTSKLPMGLGFIVDFYFDEDQHNQRIGNIFGYEDYGQVVLEVVGSNTVVPIKVAEERMKEIEEEEKKRH